MFAILFCTIIGFSSGLSYIMVRRKIKPGNILAATFLGLLSTVIWRVINDYLKDIMNNKKKRYF